MAARNSFDGLGVSEIPLKVPLRGTDFGRAMQQLMQGEANAKNILIRKREKEKQDASCWPTSAILRGRVRDRY